MRWAWLGIGPRGPSRTGSAKASGPGSRPCSGTRLPFPSAARRRLPGHGAARRGRAADRPRSPTSPPRNRGCAASSTGLMIASSLLLVSWIFVLHPPAGAGQRPPSSACSCCWPTRPVDVVADHRPCSTCSRCLRRGGPGPRVAPHADRRGHGADRPSSDSLLRVRRTERRVQTPAAVLDIGWFRRLRPDAAGPRRPPRCARPAPIGGRGHRRRAAAVRHFSSRTAAVLRRAAGLGGLVRVLRPGGRVLRLVPVGADPADRRPPAAHAAGEPLPDPRTWSPG